MDENNKLIPYCLCYYLNEKLNNFYGLDCVKNFNEILMNLDEETIIFAHNLTFDGTFLMVEITKSIKKINSLIINSSLYYISFINKKNVLIKIKCSYKFIPLSLKNINKFLNVDNKINFDYTKINMLNYKTKNLKNEVLRYCENDVKIVIEILKILDICLNKYDFSWADECNSMSSLSLYIFKNYYNDFKIKTNIKKIDDYNIRNAYYGGRCEVFGNAYDNEQVVHFDFTGMYALCMLEEFPTGFMKYDNNPTNTKKIGFYNITFVSDINIPVLPYRHPINKKLLFPNGEITGLYWYEEINYFLSLKGIIKKINFSYTFESKNFVFKKFSTELTKSRKIDKNHKIIDKFLLNSLYGRFGLSEKNIETKFLNENQFKKINPILMLKWIKINEFYYLTYKKENKDQIINSNVIYASIITSKARIKLHKGYMNVIKEGGRLLYSDTDSIFAAFPKESKILDKQMGDVMFDSKLQDTIIINSTFFSAKLYFIEYINGEIKFKIKGIRNTKEMTTNFNENFYNNINVVEKFFEKQLNHKKDFFFKETDIIKCIDPNIYDKRIFSIDKKNTTPLVIYS